MVLHLRFHLPSYFPENLVARNFLPLLQWPGVKFPSSEAGRTKADSLFLLISRFAVVGDDPRTRMFCCVSVSCLRLKCSGPAAVMCGLTNVSNVIFIITCTAKRAHRPQQLLFPFHFSCLLASGKAKNGEKRETCQWCSILLFKTWVHFLC